MITKVYDYVQKYHMIQEGDTIVAGVSGGADSVCLLFMLIEIRKKINFNLSVVHVNHGIREEAVQDEEYVRKLCEEHNIPFYLTCADVKAYAKEQGLSEEEGMTLLRDTMATWYYILMEKYGKTTREELLEGFKSADDAWESYISMHTGCIRYYDKEIELHADYRPKAIVRPEDVWKSVADIENIHAGNVRHVCFAEKITNLEKKKGFPAQILKLRQEILHITF